MCDFSDSSEDRMNIHKNARLTPLGRERIVNEVSSGQTPEAAARAAGVCPRTVRKWVARFKAEGAEGLKDRSSRPHRLHRPTPVNDLGLVEPVDRLGEGAVIGIADAADRRLDAGLGQALGILDRHIQGGFKRSSQHPADRLDPVGVAMVSMNAFMA